MAAELPPQLRNQLQLLQQLQQQAQVVISQRAQLEVQVKEHERTLEELAKVSGDAPIYRSAGSLLIRAKDKAGIEAELKEAKETAEVRLASMKRQEEKLRERLTSLQREIQAALASQQGRVAGPRGG
ncbi:MAG TPA: prefoldin subunit beta [Candidatus Thermoplasmatota archaeon]|jgi:prefoldin beta subunit|nr:prefoldin subunit beta [Candidatus Thermoplasmatota archaeon]